MLEAKMGFLQRLLSKRSVTAGEQSDAIGPNTAGPNVVGVALADIMPMGMGGPMVAIAPSRGATLVPAELFDAAAYLANNPDVAAAVARGDTSAYGFYVAYGHRDELAGARPRTLPAQSRSLSGHYTAPDAIYDRLIDLEMDNRALQQAFDRQIPHIKDISFDMLSEDVSDEVVPPLDKIECNENLLDRDQLLWRQNGYLIKPGFFPEELIDRYSEIRQRVPSKGGWNCPVPYMHVPELRDVCLYPPLMKLMEKLIGEEMGLHLNLTGWVSSDRNWHQDDYLNPPFINSWYSAVWIALDDIHPDCGPFEFVPGSHKWPLMKSHKVRMYLSPEERDADGWPWLAERFVNGVADAEIARRGCQSEKFIARKGDLLIWHGRLMHRGSYANTPGMQRKTLIGHYSGISHRIDMPVIERTDEGSAYFVHNFPLDFDPYTAVAAE
jgi:hypothetical protein